MSTYVVLFGMTAACSSCGLRVLFLDRSKQPGAGKESRTITNTGALAAYAAAHSDGLVEVVAADALRHVALARGDVDGRDALFSGDTLFCGGCGAPFEGDARDVAANFRRIWHRCGGKCLLFPGHEYSEHLLYEYFGGAYSAPWRPRAAHMVSSIVAGFSR